MIDKEQQELLQKLLEKKKAGTLTPAERYKIPPQDMPEQDPQVRKRNVNEVATGYTETHARIEALRCLRCKTAPCVKGCPVQIRIKEFVESIAEGNYSQALSIIKENSLLPAVCGRVCPHPCETDCNRKNKDGSVSINAMERYVGDFGIEKELKLTRLSEDAKSEKIAIIGSGPAGLSCAYQLARQGYPVTVFEAFSQPGGMLRYGIPKYRLPREILDAEIQRIADLGVELKCNFVVGKDATLDQLREEYKAIFVGIGAHKGYNLGVPGEDASNVFTGTEFLNKANCGEPLEIGEKVVVIGGGDTAIDAARVSKRLGADVTIIYRRTRNEMPAIAPESRSAKVAGVDAEAKRLFTGSRRAFSLWLTRIAMRVPYTADSLLRNLQRPDLTLPQMLPALLPLWWYHLPVLSCIPAF